jgi:hypothetical protein
MKMEHMLSLGIKSSKCFKRMNNKNNLNYYKKREIIKKIDIIFLIALIIIIAISLILIFTAKKGNEAKLIVDSEVKMTFNLGKNQVIKLDDYNIVIKIESQKISIIESDCPNQICVKTGAISKSNQIIVCAPKKILIVIDDNKNNNYYTGNIN